VAGHLQGRNQIRVVRACKWYVLLDVDILEPLEEQMTEVGEYCVLGSCGWWCKGSLVSTEESSLQRGCFSLSDKQALAYRPGSLWKGKQLGLFIGGMFCLDEL
jgi:hypothetical protein